MNRYQIISIVLLTVIFCFEQYFPSRKRVPYWWSHFRRNCILGGLNGLLSGVTSAVISVCIICWINDRGFGFLNMWEMPNTLKFILTVLLFDCWIYAWHWMNHQSSFLWRFHRVHHNDPAMDMTTALRFHPVEIMISSCLNIIIIAIVGVKLEYLIVYKAIFHANVLFHHSNINISDKVDRAMRTILVSPNMHRVHHSDIREETDSNYSSLFSFWDRIFGTYRRKGNREIKFGLETWMEEKWQTVKGLLVLPFQNKK